MAPDPRIKRLRAVAAASTLRSPLGRWFSANREEFEKLLRDYRPRWEALVEQFANDGLLNPPPEFNSDDEGVRKVTRRRVVKSVMRTWERVKVQAARKEPPKPAAVESKPIARHVEPTKPATTATATSGHDDIRSLLSTGRKLPDPI
jgi:hypothetical protein